MTYLPNIPQPNDDIAVSQGQILANFQVNNSTLAVDHYEPANASSDKGFHRKSMYVEQDAIPTTLVVPPELDRACVYAYPVTFSAVDSPTISGETTLLWHRGPDDAEPYPITNLTGVVSVPGGPGSQNLISFAGFSTVHFRISVYCTSGVAANIKNYVGARAIGGTLGLGSSYGGLTGPVDVTLSGDVVKLDNGTLAAINCEYCIEFLRLVV